MQDELLDVVGSIYEAAAIPEIWPAVLARLSDIYGFRGGAITWSGSHRDSWICSPNIHEDLEAFFVGGWHTRNERLTRTYKYGRFSFVQDADVMDQYERDQLPLYREFLHPRGLGQGAGTVIGGPDGIEVAVIFERPFTTGEIPNALMRTLDALRPHLARSLMLSGRLERDRTNSVITALKTVGCPAALIGAGGKVLDLTPQFLRAQTRIRIRAADRLSLGDDRANLLLKKALENSDYTRVYSIPLPQTDVDTACVLHIVPLRRSARDLAPLASSIAFLCVPSKIDQHSGAILKGLYDLTKGEVRVALALLKGAPLPETANSLGLSYETIRSFAKSIYAKTGSRGQPDLIARLSFVSGPEHEDIFITHPPIE